MNSSKTLAGPSLLQHKKPKKLIFMLHGYGDTAENFIHIAKYLDQTEWHANYIALDAPNSIPNYPAGRQWFPINLNSSNNIEMDESKRKIVNCDILESVKLLNHTIDKIKDSYDLSYKDCFLLGFSQGGMIAFEFGNYCHDRLGGLAILSGRIIREKLISNFSLLKTPIFISHGEKDEVIPIKLYHSACAYLSKNKLLYEGYVIKEDGHTISLDAINLLQKFIKKNL